MYLFFRSLFRALTGTTVRSGNFAAQRGASLVATIDHPSFDLCYSSSLLALRLAISDSAYVLETGQVTLSGPAATLARDESLTASYLGG